jgi:hypothetical protein
MAIDIRAKVYCRIGDQVCPLINASVSDDYIQGTGLLKTKGSCELQGMYAFQPNDRVRLSYRKDDVLRQVPRHLVVISSFADPLRKTTKVEFGCKLTVTENYREPLVWRPTIDPDEDEFDPEDSKIVTIPIRASQVAVYAASKLGTFLSGAALTNKFSISEFDFSPGYFQVLSDLLISENQFGYMSPDGSSIKVQPINIRNFNSTKTIRVVDENKIIDLGPIGVGPAPPATFAVSFSSLRLKAPDNEEVVCRLATEDPATILRWGEDYTSSSTTSRATYDYKVNGQDPLLFKTYNWEQSAQEATEYTTYGVYESGKYEKVAIGEVIDRTNETKSLIDGYLKEYRNLVTRRTVLQKTGSAAIGGSYARDLLSNGFSFGNFDVYRRTVETFTYDDRGKEILRVADTYGSLLFLYGTAGINTVYTNPDGSKSAIGIGQATGGLERIEVETVYTDNIVKRITKRYGPWAETISGQQAIARAREDVTTAQQAEIMLNRLFGGLYLIDVTIDTTIEGERGAQEVPSDADIIKSQYAEGSGDPDNGYSTPSVSDFVTSSGGSTGVSFSSFSLPYAPDDTFTRRIVSTDPLRYCYYTSKADPESAAAAFGRCQASLQYGMRYGINIQTVPHFIPNTPLTFFGVKINNVVGVYATNGLNWTMDAEGVVISTDALYSGAGGKLA